jgi:hypothetical protein
VKKNKAWALLLEYKNLVLNSKYPPYLTKKGIKDGEKARLLEEQIISAMCDTEEEG